MKLQDQVCTPRQAVEFSSFGFSTKESLYSWIVKFEKGKQGQVIQTNTLYYLVRSLGKSIKVFSEVVEGDYEFSKDETMSAFSGPAFNTAELGMMLGPVTEHCQFHLTELHPGWGFTTKEGGDFFHGTEAESRAHLVLGLVEMKKRTVNELIDCLNYEAI